MCSSDQSGSWTRAGRDRREAVDERRANGFSTGTCEIRDAEKSTTTEAATVEVIGEKSEFEKGSGGESGGDSSAPEPRSGYAHDQQKHPAKASRQLYNDEEARRVPRRGSGGEEGEKRPSAEGL